MNKNSFIRFSFLMMSLLIAGDILSAQAAGDPEANNDPDPRTIPTEMKSDADGITPHSYKSMMLRNEQAQANCWRCSSPCSSYACCNDGYPQCCIRGGRCGCCRG